MPKFLREEVERFIEEKMAGYGYEKHLTDFEIKREAEKQEKKRLAEERSRAFWLRRNLDKQMNEDSSD